MNRYHYSRFTHDIDFMIEPSAFPALEKEMNGIGYKEALRTNLFVRMKGISENDMMIDFLFADRKTMEKLKHASDRVTIDNRVFLVPSLFHLIAMKLHSIKNSGRHRFTTDMTDIVKLIQVNNINIEDESFKRMCLKFGNDDLYNQIVNGIKEDD